MPDSRHEGYRRDAVSELAASPRKAAGGRRRGPEELQVFAGLGAVLRQLRRRARLTQGDLAAATALTRAMISAYENARTLPSLPTLDRILAALGVSLTDLGRELEVERRVASSGILG